MTAARSSVDMSSGARATRRFWVPMYMAISAPEKIWGLRYDGQSVTEQMLLNDSSLSISSFGTDLARNLYILSRVGIYRLVAAD